MVFASQAEGVLELLGEAADQQTARLDRDSNPYEKLLEILGNSQLAAVLGHRNQERAIQQFSVENMIAQYELLYFTLVGR